MGVEDDEDRCPASRSDGGALGRSRERAEEPLHREDIQLGRERSAVFQGAGITPPSRTWRMPLSRPAPNLQRRRLRAGLHDRPLQRRRSEALRRARRPCAAPNLARPAAGRTFRAAPAAHSARKIAHRTAQSAPAPKRPAQTGTVVEHPKYGTGTIVRREGEGDDAKIVVIFQRHGMKKLVEKYAGLKKVLIKNE